MKRFEVGKTYSTRSICDHNCIFKVTVAKRTAKTVTTTEGKRLGVAKGESEYNDAETIFPTGRYSMAPAITANDEGLIVPDYSKG